MNDDDGPDYVFIASLILAGTVVLPVLWALVLPILWALALILSPFLIVWLAGRWVYLAVKERHGVTKLREKHRNLSAKWHGENMRDCCKLLGGTEDDIAVYVRMQRIYAGYYKNNALNGKDDAWWAEALSYAKRTPSFSTKKE